MRKGRDNRHLEDSECVCGRERERERLGRFTTYIFVFLEGNLQLRHGVSSSFMPCLPFILGALPLNPPLLNKLPTSSVKMRRIWAAMG